MIIICSDTKGHENIYYIENVNSLEGVKGLADQGLPIKCYKVDGAINFRTLFDKDAFKEVYLYLNQYCSFREYKGLTYFSDKKTINEFWETVCYSCRCKYSFCCKYERDGFKCKNHKKESYWKIRDWLKGIK